MNPRGSLTLVAEVGSMEVHIAAEADALYVGRSSRCRVRLPATARLVSRLHAQLTYRDGYWYVIDVSRQGTFVDDRRIPAGQPVAIRHDQRLRFGECRFRARLPVRDAEIGNLEDTFAVSIADVDLVAINSSRILRSALELPELLGNVSSEPAMYDAACAYLVTALAPVIASAYVTVLDADGSMELLGRADRRDGAAHSGGPMEPMVSRRVLQRLQRAPATVLFLYRHQRDGTLNATLPSSALAVGASLLETDARGRPTLLYAFSDRNLASGEELVAQYLRLVATLMRQHAQTLRRAHLANYFSPNLVKLLVQPGGSALIEDAPRVMQATSLFFDVRGSSLPHDASAELLARSHADLSRIITLVTDAVFECDGTIIDYAGDGVFAAWGVPLPQPDQAARAVSCAVRIIERLRRQVFHALPQDPKRPLCGIGIAKGEVLSGRVGSSVVLKYGILGPSVNAAQRLATLTKPDQLNRPVLISATVHGELADRKFPTRRVGLLPLTGMPGEVEVFEVLVDADAS